MDLFSLFSGHAITFDPVELAIIYFLWRMNKLLGDMKIAGIKRDLKLDNLAKDFNHERQNTERRFKLMEPSFSRKF